MDNNELLKPWLDEPKHLKHLLLGIDDLNTLDKQTLIDIVQAFIHSDAIEYKVLKKRGAPPKTIGESIYPIFACVIKAKLTGKSFKDTWNNYQSTAVPKKPKLTNLYETALVNLFHAFKDNNETAIRAVRTFELKAFMLEQIAKPKKVDD